MKNFLHQNRYLIIAGIFMFVFQVYNALIVKSQIIDWEEEQSYCSNWSEDYSPITPLQPPPPPEPTIIVDFILEERPASPGDGPHDVPYVLVPYYYEYNCPNYDTIIVEPNVDWELFGSSVSLNPKETTEYTITYKVSNDRHCNNVYTMKVTIEVIEACSFSDDAIKEIQTEYPWIEELENVCMNSIEVYEKNNTKYLVFNNPKSTVLYFQDGSRLCKDSPDYSCLEAYQIGNKVKTWFCSQPVDNTTGGNENSEQAVFNTYPWLSEKIDQNNCSNKIINVYDADTYEFVVVKTDLGESMFDTNGALICFSAAGGFSFIGLYDESRILDSWACDENFQGKQSSLSIQNTGIQLFPNPAKDNLFINLQELAFEQATISLYNVQGKQVKQMASADAFAGIVQMDVSDLERGIYLVEVRTKENILTEKLLIK